MSPKLLDPALAPGLAVAIAGPVSIPSWTLGGERDPSPVGGKAARRRQQPVRPRPGRGGRCENCTCASAEPRYDARAFQRSLEKHSEPPLRAVPKPTEMPPVPTEWWPLRVQLRAGDGGSDPGQILEGRYGINGGFIFFSDDLGKPPRVPPPPPHQSSAGVAAQ